jgi:hypothetical protein
MTLWIDDWVEIPTRTSEEVQRVGKVASVEFDHGGGLYKFSVWWETVPYPCGQAQLGHYVYQDLASGFIRPLGILDRLAREA